MALLEKFNSHLDRLIDQKCKHVAVAVSGGADSICLTFLVDSWARQNNIHLTAITVDHGLRPESSLEAEQVHQWLSSRGINHHVLKWIHSGIETHIQEKARSARYGLLQDYCVSHGINNLLLGHTQDDQYETVILRLCHNSGVDGLAGIPFIRGNRLVKLIRPLLDTSKEEIVDFLQKSNITWLEDPSNKLEKYTRIKIRNNQNTFKEFGITMANVLRFQSKMASVRQEKERVARGFWECHGELHEEGYVYISLSAFLEVPYDIRERILISIVKLISGNIYPIRMDSLIRLHEKIIDGDFSAYVCHGCLIQKRQEKLLFCRELSCLVSIPLGDTEVSDDIIWDNRYKVIVPKSFREDGYFISPIGDAWKDFQTYPKIKVIPHPVRRTLPAIMRKEQLISVPHLDYYDYPEELSRCKLLFLPTIDLCQLHFIFN